jgi:hypothetical protein
VGLFSLRNNTALNDTTDTEQWAFEKSRNFTISSLYKELTILGVVNEVFFTVHNTTQRSYSRIISFYSCFQWVKWQFDRYILLEKFFAASYTI